MKTQFRLSAIHDFATTRKGVTLSEVLVSMVIMSIGIVLLATLLPISILRTAQATQLTHAVFLRNNAEAAIESNRGLLSNSQIDPTQVQNTTNGITYAVIDPIGSFLVNQANFGGINSRPRFAGGCTTLSQAENLAQLPDSWTLVTEGLVTANLGATPPIVMWNGPSLSGLNVRNGQFGQNAPHRIILYDATGSTAAIQPLYQVIGQTLSWWNVDNTGVSLTTGALLPYGFIPVRARIEVLQRRFTWMMTARKRLVPVSSGDKSWTSEIDLAVFYNRAFATTDEAPHRISSLVVGPDGQPGVALVDDDGQNGVDDFGELGWSGSDDNQLGFDSSAGVASVDDNNDLTVDNLVETGWLGSDDNRTISVELTNKPLLKKGGFLLEPSQLKWYRIVNVRLSSGDKIATVLLDQDLRLASGTTFSQGVFMKGVVEVYSLGSRTGQQ